jgi:hypothetical protein
VALKQFNCTPGSEEVQLGAVCSGILTDADKVVSAAVSQASICLLINNPKVVPKFDLGDEYYVKFTPIAKPEKEIP